MKLKTFLLGGLFLIPFFSCENSEEFSIVQTETELVAQIEIFSETVGSPELKSLSEQNEFQFSGTGHFCLMQNKELGKPMCTFEKIEPRDGCKLLLSDAGTEGKTLSLKLKWGYLPKGESDFLMNDEIDLSSLSAVQKNGNIEIDLTSIINPMVNCINCNSTCMFKVEITGEASFNYISMASLTIPLLVSEKIYYTRFSVF